MYRSAIAGVVLIGVLAPGFTAAQDPDVETPGLAESLTELNETLGEIRRLLAQQLETQNLALLMTRVEFSTRASVDPEALEGIGCRAFAWPQDRQPSPKGLEQRRKTAMR